MTKRFILDVMERVLRTYAQTFIGLLIASGFAVDGVVDLSVVVKAGIAALPAVLSLLMSLLARGVGDKESASLVDASVAA